MSCWWSHWSSWSSRSSKDVEPFNGPSRIVFRFQTYVLALGLTSAASLLGEVDVRELIRRAVAADERNWKVARNYASSERVDYRRLDSTGQLKSREVTTFDVTLPHGSPYRRLTARDDRPLLPAEEKKEQERLRKRVAERQKETPRQRSTRIEEYVMRPEWQRDAWRELPEAFDFRLVSNELLGGVSVYVIEAMPRLSYQPRSSTAKVLRSLHGKLWVDKGDYHLVKAEVEVIDNIWVGLFLVRLDKGSRVFFEQTWVNNEVWLPLRVRALLSARLGLIKALRLEHEVYYSESREFPPGSPVIAQTKER